MSKSSPWILALLLSPAARGATCEPTDEAAFRSVVLDAQAAVDRGDVELSAAIVDEALTSLPCLTFSPAPRVWADLLVTLAIVEFSRGGDWQSPMTTALHIRPMVDRGVASGHPLASFDPPEPAPPAGPVPEGARIHVDGLEVNQLPSGGMHLIQRTDGRFWNTALMVDEPLPDGWAEARVEAPPRIAGWVTAGGLLGFGSTSQTPNWDSDWIPTRTDITRTVLGGAVEGAVTFYSPFGIAFAGMAPLMRESPGWDGRVAGIWTHRGLHLGGGIGTHGIDTHEGNRQRVTMLRYGFGTVHLRSGRAWRWDAGLTIGGSGALARTLLRAGLTWPDTGGNRWRAGLDLSHARAEFGQNGAPARQVVTSQTRLMFQLGLAFGEY